MKHTTLLLFALGFLYSCTGAQDEGIAPFPENPSYWQFKGKPLMLLGGSDDDNLYQWTGDALQSQLEALTEAGGNYLRCTMSYRDGGNLKPWLKNENGKYDLNLFNEEYWERFSHFLAECDKRDIIIQLEIWATYDYLTSWANSPFNPVNNINYTSENTSLEPAYDPGIWPGEKEKPCPFYHTVPAKNNDRTVLAFQQAFIDKMLSISLAYDNILYCIDNEIWTSAPLEWGWYWGRYIHEKAADLEKRVYVTEMYCFPGIDIRYGKDGMESLLGVIDHPEIFDYLDISNTGMFSGEYFYRQVYEVYKRVREQDTPRPVNIVKVYGNPGAGYDLAVASGGPETFWIALTSGMASVRFHRPTTGIGINPEAVTIIRGAAEFSDLIRPWECEPRMDMTFDNYQNEAYLLANPGKAYGLYFPRTGLDGEIAVNLSDAEGDLSLKWLNVETGKWLEGEKLTGGDWRRLKVPDGKSRWGWAAVLVR